MPTAYITAPTDSADDLAELLVEKRLAACVNRFPCTSVYRWEGEVVHDDEVILLAKTTDSAWEELVARVEAEHPYDVPCIERFEEDEIVEGFAKWIGEEVD